MRENGGKKRSQGKTTRVWPPAEMKKATSRSYVQGITKSSVLDTVTEMSIEPLSVRNQGYEGINLEIITSK
jgi:hypothetical protein